MDMDTQNHDAQQCRIAELEQEINALQQDRRALIALQEELRNQNEQLIQAESLLTLSSQRYQQLFNTAPIGYLTLDEHGRIHEINPMALTLLDRTDKDLLGKLLSSWLNSSSRETLRRHLREAFANPDETIQCQLTIKYSDPLRTLQADSLVLSDEQHPLCRMTLTDISELLAQQAHQRLSSQVLDEMHEGVMVTSPDQRIVLVNRAFSEVTGYRADEVLGQSPHLLSSGRHGANFYEHMWRSIHRAGFWHGEIWNRRKNGEVYPEWLSISSINDHFGRAQYYVAVFSDISDRKKSELALQRLAHYDALTGLPNRTLLHDRLNMAMAAAKRNHEQCAILFIDLDKFKKVNDTFGHREGDLLLKEASERMHACIREADTLARLGGDEFAVVLSPDVDEHRAGEIAGRLVSACTHPFLLGENTHFIGASVGIALYPEDGEDVATLLQHADIAMYEAKKSGRACVRRYRVDTGAMIAERHDMEALIRWALSNDGVVVMYQPQVRSIDNRLVGFEALVRLKDMKGKLVSPAKFIPVAEETGLIFPLSARIIDLGLQQIVQWREDGLFPVTIAFNLSAQQLLQPDFLPDMLARMNELEIPPQCVALEVTESQAIENYSQAMDLLGQLRERGIGVAIDDFGAGFSSLTHLKNLPIDTLKIDKAFIDDIPGDVSAESLVESILGMAKTLGLEVVAEGAENIMQLNWLKGQRCDIIQGYVYAPPLPAEDAADWLHKQHSKQE